MAEQVPFGSAAVELASNPEPRCPCVLLLDVSGSMMGAPIAALNAGLQVFQTELQSDSLAAQRVEIAIVTFGGRVETIQDFQGAQSFHAPTLVTGGETPMGEAVRRAVEMVAQRKATYKQAGLHYFRPWIFLITDGVPTDEWASAAQSVRQGEMAKGFALFAVGVAGANFDMLRQLAVRDPLKLDGLKFRELFVWLSQSMRSPNPSRARRTRSPSPIRLGGRASRRTPHASAGVGATTTPALACGVRQTPEVFHAPTRTARRPARAPRRFVQGRG